MNQSRHLPDPLGNRLLSRLPSSELDRLRPHFRAVQLEFNTIVQQARQKAEHVYFPTRGVLSALHIMEEGAAIEVGTIGKEGMSPSLAFLGEIPVVHRMLVQVEGEAMRIESRKFRELCEKPSPLHELMVRYHTAWMLQVSQSVACNGLHSVERRCARWLLMTHDRAGKDDFPMTHEFLAMMLGVRRASVSLVLQPLQEDGLISSQRGQITVLNRLALEVKSCECFQFVKTQSERLLDGADIS